MTSTAINRLWSLALLWLAAASAFAAPRLKDLDINVVLSDNGDARITEVRQMTIDLSNTECYISIGNLKGQRITDLEVSDEHGNKFENVGHWDTKKTRIEKSYKCGLIEKDNGYEICWGIGGSGERVYTVSYTVTSLLRNYRDGDGFNWQFIARKLKPSAEHARVTISREEGSFEKSNTRVWSFNHEGTIHVVGGKVVAETTKPMNEQDAMTVMVIVDSGIFHPSKSESKSSEELKEEALKNSDYNNMSIKDILYILLVIVIPLLWLGIYVYRVWHSRRMAKSDLDWYRDIPYKGNLLRANCILNAHRYKKNDYKNLLSAAVLRLLSTGSLRIEEHFVEAGRLARMVGRQGSMTQCFVIGQLIAPEGLFNNKMITLLYKIFEDAAGPDRILQPNELKTWMSHNQDRVVELMEIVMEKMPIKEVNKDMENVRKVYGLQKFLKDFTLANERHVQEVALWKEYLVWAELFGIAKQVRQDMMRINPEFLRMDNICRAMLNDNTVKQFTAVTLYNTSKAEHSINSRNSGGGGSSSYGGGGGFSGGGSGGGLR